MSLEKRRIRSAVLTATLLAAGAVAPVPAEELNSIVLRVNDEIATAVEYRDRRDARTAAIREVETLSPEERAQLLSEAPRATMREILDELLLLSRARQLVIEPSRGEIDEAIDSTRQRMGIPDEATFEAALRNANMTIEDYRDRTSRSIKANQVIQREVNPKINVEDEFLQRYYREHPDEFRIPARVRVRELVVPSEGAPGPETRAAAEALRQAIVDGETMEAAAERLGSDRVTGPVDLGWVEPGELAPGLDTAVWALPQGGLSAAVEGRGGLHLLEVEERVESSLKPYTEVKPEIEARERERRHDEVLKKYLGDLERSAYIVEHIPAEAEGFREAEAPDENDPLSAFAPKREASSSPPPMEPIKAPVPPGR